MSDTPMTDEAAFEGWSGQPDALVTSDFARRLERELNAAKARAEKAEAELSERKTLHAGYAMQTLNQSKEITALRSERDALRKALEQSKNGVELAHGYLVHRNLGDSAKIVVNALESTRTVIDAALHGTAKRDVPETNFGNPRWGQHSRRTFAARRSMASPAPAGSAPTLRLPLLGATLRDYFAAKALPSALAEDGGTVESAAKQLGINAKEYDYETHWPILAARRAYAYADAMLAARKANT